MLTRAKTLQNILECLLCRLWVPKANVRQVMGLTKTNVKEAPELVGASLLRDWVGAASVHRRSHGEGRPQPQPEPRGCAGGLHQLMSSQRGVHLWPFHFLARSERPRLDAAGEMSNQHAEEAYQTSSVQTRLCTTGASNQHPRPRVHQAEGQ